MGVMGLFEVGDASLAHQESAPDIDTLDQAKAFDLRLFRGRDIDGTGIIDQDVYLAKFGDGAGSDIPDLVLEADISLNRQHLPAAGSRDLFRGGIDRSF